MINLQNSCAGSNFVVVILLAVSTCHKHLKVPITCKIRIFESLDKTVEYAKMLERAGCQVRYAITSPFQESIQTNIILKFLFIYEP